MIEFKAYKHKLKVQQQLAWLNGFYVKKAIDSSIFMCGLADNQTIRKLPNYPDFPDDEEEVMSKKEIENKREYMIAKMNYWTKTNNKRFNK